MTLPCDAAVLVQRPVSLCHHPKPCLTPLSLHFYLQSVLNNYETDLIYPIVSKAAELAGLDYHTANPAAQTALKVIGDHTRAVVYLISDGVLPSNVGRGYVVRRLLRRVVMKGRLLGIRDQFTSQVAEVAINLSAACDPQVRIWVYSETVCKDTGMPQNPDAPAQYTCC